VNNRGAAGVDGMTVEELKPYLKDEWKRIREVAIDARTDQPRGPGAGRSGNGNVVDGALRIVGGTDASIQGFKLSLSSWSSCCVYGAIKEQDGYCGRLSRRSYWGLPRGDRCAVRYGDRCSQ